MVKNWCEEGFLCASHFESEVCIGMCFCLLGGSWLEEDTGVGFAVINTLLEYVSMDLAPYDVALRAPCVIASHIKQVSMAFPIETRLPLQ